MNAVNQLKATFECSAAVYCN